MRRTCWLIEESWDVEGLEEKRCFGGTREMGEERRGFYISIGTWNTVSFHHSCLSLGLQVRRSPISFFPDDFVWSPIENLLEIWGPVPDDQIRGRGWRTGRSITSTFSLKSCWTWISGYSSRTEKEGDWWRINDSNFGLFLSEIQKPESPLGPWQVVNRRGDTRCLNIWRVLSISARLFSPKVKKYVQFYTSV